MKLAFLSLLAYAALAESGEAGRARFNVRCAGCHGENGLGGERAPAIGKGSRKRLGSEEAIRTIITRGIPDLGMPAFSLPPPELEQVTAYIRTRVMPLRDTAVGGDASAGEHYFFGEDGCAPCHMVHGRGGVTGPDLTESSLTLTHAEIQVAVIHRPEHRAALLQHRTDLIAFLRAAPEWKPTQAAPAALPGAITWSQIANPKTGEWPTYNGRLDGNRYSELRQVNLTNVSTLAPAWLFPAGSGQALETTPIVVDGVMYVTAVNSVTALDARTGRRLWNYQRPRSKGLVGDAAGGINRGVAVLGDRVFLVTDNAHLLAIHRVTGGLIWDTEMADARQHYGATSAPLVVRDLVISGISGGDEGVRGFLAAYRADSGERVWNFKTVPDRTDAEAATWVGTALEHGCGSTWLTGTYDTATDTLFWPVGNPCPDFNGDQRKGDNLYTDSVLALDPATGKRKWHYQFTPHDLHDWDATETPMVVGGHVLQANRNGFFYTLDATTGKFLSATPFVAKLNWASGIDASGRPMLIDANQPSAKGTEICPSMDGATNWMSNAYHPGTGLFYVVALEKCNVFSKNGEPWKQGESFYGGAARPVTEEKPKKFIRAIQVSTGKTVWEQEEAGPGEAWGGLLATAGGLLFAAEESGAFLALNAVTGQPVWRFELNTKWHASPMTYAVEGKQYIAIAAGSDIVAFAVPLAQSQQSTNPTLPALLDRLQGEWNADQAMTVMKRVYSTDRYFTFPKFTETARYLNSTMREIGLTRVETINAPADGKTQVGFWTEPLAWDVKSATLDLLDDSLTGPQRMLADYSKVPASLGMWSGATPAGGVSAEIVAVKGFGPWPGQDLKGKLVLTDVNPAGVKWLLVKAGALGAINTFTENPALPDGRQWINAWGDDGWAYTARSTPLLCFSISPRQAALVRGLLQRGPVHARATVNSRYFKGAYPYVTGVIEGTGDEEVLTLGHSSEQGAQDNATGVAATFEALATLQRLIAAGKLPKPKRSIRILSMGEMYGSLHYIQQNPDRVRHTVAALCVDTPAASYDLAGTEYTFYMNPHVAKDFTDAFILKTASEYLARVKRPWHEREFTTGTDTYLAEPMVGIPTVWGYSGSGVETHHNSEDTPDRVDARSLRDISIINAAFLYYIANAGEAEALWLAQLSESRGYRKIEERAAELEGAKANIGQIAYAVDRETQAVRSVERLVALERKSALHLELDLAASRLQVFGDQQRNRFRPGTQQPENTHEEAQKIVVRRKRFGTIPLDDLPHDQWGSFPSGAWATIPTIALYWCDGHRNLAEVARLTRLELGPTNFDFVAYFRFLERFGYVEFKR